MPNAADNEELVHELFEGMQLIKTVAESAISSGEKDDMAAALNRAKVYADHYIAIATRT